MELQNLEKRKKEVEETKKVTKKRAAETRAANFDKLVGEAGQRYQGQVCQKMMKRTATSTETQAVNFQKLARESGQGYQEQAASSKSET